MYQTIMNKLLSDQNLTERETKQVMNQIMQGELTYAQIASFLTALRIKGETVVEIVGCAQAMRDNAVQVRKDYSMAIDTCGTGGDGRGTFNISTITAFVVAGAGLKVAKHGNRSVSSRSGSADLFEALGIDIHLTPSEVEECLQEVGIAFFFAPIFHPAMKYAIIPRKEIGFHTIFNLLGPLTNPAGVKCQVLGVYAPSLTEMIARVLVKLGTQEAMVVSSESGIDEISLTEKTKISRVKSGTVETFYLEPEDLGLGKCNLEDIQGADVNINAEIAIEILENKIRNSRRDIVLANSAAALITGGKAKDWKGGVKKAEESIDSGAALQKLKDLKAFSIKGVAR